MRLLHLYGDLQTLLRFHKNKYTDNNQLQSHVEIFETIIIVQHHKEMWEGVTNIRRKERTNFALYLFFFIILMNRS